MEIVGLIALAVIVLDPGLLRGILTPRRAVNGAAGGTPGGSPAGGPGTNTLNGGPGPTAQGAGVGPAGATGPASSSGGGTWIDAIGGAVKGLGSVLGAVGLNGSHGTGSPAGSQPDQFDPASRGGNTTTGTTSGDPSFANNGSDPGPTQTDDTGALWGSGGSGDQGPSFEYGSGGGQSTDSNGALWGSGGTGDQGPSGAYDYGSGGAGDQGPTAF